MQVAHICSDTAPLSAPSSSSSSALAGPGPGSHATHQLRQLQTAAAAAGHRHRHSLGPPQLEAAQAQHASLHMALPSTTSQRRGGVQLGGLQQFWRARHTPPPGAAAAAGVAAQVAPSMLDVAVRLWRQRALFRGLSINYIKVIPSTAIGFTLYDATKAYLGISS